MTAPSSASVPTFEIVEFEGVDILAARSDQTVFVPMKRFCATLGLPWEPQRKRIARDEILKDSCSMMEVPSEGGPQLQTVLPLDLIPGFLFSAEAKRYAPELQQRVRTFRRGCYGALYRHFFGTPPAAASTAPSPHLGAAPRSAPADAAALVAAIRGEPRADVRAFFVELLRVASAELGLAPPPPEAIRPPAGPPRLLLDLLVGLATLEARGVRYNHLAGTAEPAIALNLPELGRLFARHDIDVDTGAPLRALLAAGVPGWRTSVRTVSRRRLGRRRAVFCHVLEPWGDRAGGAAA